MNEQTHDQSPTRAFTEFNVSGEYAIAKGFRPSWRHLPIYLDRFSKEGWRLVQILDSGTTTTLIFRQRETVSNKLSFIGDYKGKALFIDPAAPAEVRREIRSRLMATPDVQRPLKLDPEKVHHTHARWSGDFAGLRKFVESFQPGWLPFFEAEKATSITHYWEVASVASVKRLILLAGWKDRVGFEAFSESAIEEAARPKPYGRRVNDDDPVNPKHYDGTTCAEIGELLTANSYQVLKYNWRLGQKDDPCVEIGKSLWYLDREIALCKDNTERPVIVKLPSRDWLAARLVGKDAHVEAVAAMLWSFNKYGDPNQLVTLRQTLVAKRAQYECGSGLAI